MKELVEEFNKKLENLKCCFRLQYMNENVDKEEFKIVPTNILFIDVAYIQSTNDFNNILENFFKKGGVILSHNNDRTIYWRRKDCKNK